MELNDFKQWFLHPETLSQYSSGVVAIGAFDGCHLGHQQLLTRSTVALSFVPAPKSFFNISEKVLTLPDEKRNLYPNFVFLRFDEHLAGLSPDQFVVLIKNALDPKTIIIGWDFHFGRNMKGNSSELQKLGLAYGIGVDVIPPFKQGQYIVKSSPIREWIRQGNLEKANQFLGYPYFISARIVHGKAIGRTLGFPTINLEVPFQKLLPKTGVYGGNAEIEGVEYPAAISVIERDKTLVEAHILNFNRDVYGKQVKLSFSFRVRGQKDFESFEALKAQIAKDVATVREKLLVV